MKLATRKNQSRFRWMGSSGRSGYRGEYATESRVPRQSLLRKVVFELRLEGGES